MKTRLTFITLGLLVCCVGGWATDSAQAQEIQHRIVPPPPQLRANVARAAALDQAAATALCAGDYTQAEGEERQSIAVLPFNSGVSEEQLARALGAQGKTQEELKAYQQIAASGGSFPRNLLPYALLLLKTGQRAQAVAAFDKALPSLGDGDLVRANSSFGPTTPEPTALAAAIHVALGLAYDGECDWAGYTQNDRAMLEYHKALQMEPNFGLANYYYGYGLQKLGRTAEARAAFTKTLRIAKGGVKAAAQRALASPKKPV